MSDELSRPSRVAHVRRRRAAIQFALIELPLVGLGRAPNHARTLTGKLNDWRTADRRMLIVIVPSPERAVTLGPPAGGGAETSG